MEFSKTKIFSILAVCALGLLISLGNFFNLGIFSDNKVHLGLDLKGGSQLLLKIDYDAYIKDQLQFTIDELKTAFRKNKIRTVPKMKIDTNEENEKEVYILFPILENNYKDKKIAVLIPCYNESLTIEKVVKDYKKVLPNADIYVYDNNSTDGTDEIAKKAGAIVRYEYRQGKGNVIRSMFKDIDADCYLMIDGDDTYPCESAKEMCEYVLEGKADMVIGDRLSSTYFTENKRAFHNFGNKLVRSLINHLFKSNIRDIMTGYRAFSYDFVKTFPVLSRGFEIERTDL